MNIVKVAESSLQARMDRHAFEINVCIQNQDLDGSVDKLLKAMSDYNRAASQFEVLQKVKSQISSEEEPSVDNNDES
tara:strand:+ start:87 stop:317 length:231 start_codon:yes stop_codon:yes gene_type:complete